jgi:hypothetical protein
MYFRLFTKLPVQWITTISHDHVRPLIGPRMP